MTADVAELLSVLLDAVDVPLPASGDDERAFSALLERRTTIVRTVLEGIVSDGRIAPYDADSVRRSVARSPVAYEPYRP